MMLHCVVFLFSNFWFSIYCPWICHIWNSNYLDFLIFYFSIHFFLNLLLPIYFFYIGVVIIVLLFISFSFFEILFSVYFHRLEFTFLSVGSFARFLFYKLFIKYFCVNLFFIFKFIYIVYIVNYFGFRTCLHIFPFYFLKIFIVIYQRWFYRFCN